MLIKIPLASYENKYNAKNCTKISVHIILLSGKKLKRRVNVNVKQSMISDGTTAIIDMPELGIHLDILNQDLKHVDTAMKQIRSSYRKDFHVQMKSLTLFRAKLQVCSMHN